MAFRATSRLVKVISITFLLIIAKTEDAQAENQLLDEKIAISNKIKDAPKKLFLSIEVNRKVISGLFYAELMANNQLILDEAAWVAANLKLVGDQVLMANRQFGYNISTLPSVTYEIDYKSQSLKIQAIASAFGINNLSKPLLLADPVNKSAMGAYLNYNLSSIMTQGNQGVKNHGAFIEGVVFNQYGSFISGLALSSVNGQPKSVRTETYFQKDIPLSMEKIIIGDTISSAGTWSRPIRFGGVVWSTDFNLQQGFVGAATPSINGSAALPSTVDILIDNQKRQSDVINAGPFEIINFPTVTGAGQINVLVRDILGVQTLTTQRFYSTPRLLKLGLNEFSFEMGMERKNYGLESNGYSKPFVAQSYRHGLDGYTLELRTEIQQFRQAIGIGFAGLIQKYAVFHLALAASNTKKQQGLHKIFGIERISQNLNLNFQMEHFDRGFLQIGALAGEIKPRQKLLLGLGVNVYRNIWMSHNFISQSNWNSDKFNLASANVSIPLIRNISLNLYMNKQFGRSKDYTGGFNINMPFTDARNSAISSDQNAEGEIHNNVEFNQGIVNGTGFGYRVRASDNPDQQMLANVVARTPINIVSLDAAQSQSSASFRLNASGSIGVLGGLPFASQSIGHGSFAVIKVADEKNIDVYLSNRKIATTNARGLALIPNLLPYQQNKISIRPEDLPFDLDINETTLLLNPYARSGLFEVIDVKKTNNRLIRLVNADNTFVAMGTKVRVSPSNRDFIVAKRGEVYLTGLSSENSLVVYLEAATCSANLSAPISSPDKNTVIIVRCR